MKTLDDFHDYQHDVVTEFYERSHVMGIMPTGAGKTVTSLTAFKELQDEGVVRKGIVIGTRRIISDVWPAEPRNWEHLQGVKVEPLVGTPNQRLKALEEKDADLYAINFNNVKGLFLHSGVEWDRDDPRYDILIIDECSFLKSPTSKWAKVLRSFSLRFKNVWLMTGSPRPNSEADYFNNMAILSKDELWGSSFYKWRDMYFYPTDFKRRVFEPHEFYRREIIKDVAKYSFTVPAGAVPRPASDPIIHKFQLPKSAREHYKTMLRKLFVKLVKKDVSDEYLILALNKAASSGKLAQITQGFMYDTEDEEGDAFHIHDEKIQLMKEFREGSEGLPTVTLYWFKEDLKRLMKAFPDASMLGAGQSSIAASQVVKDWNAGRIQNLFLHPASAAHGLNLQAIEAQLMHYCITWSMEQYMQAVARIARQGYMGVQGDLSNLIVLNNHLVADDTVDQTKIDRVLGKADAEADAIAQIRELCC